MHLFHVTENDTRLTWMSKDNRNRSIPIKDIKDVRAILSMLYAHGVTVVSPMFAGNFYSWDR